MLLEIAATPCPAGDHRRRRLKPLPAGSWTAANSRPCSPATGASRRRPAWSRWPARTRTTHHLDRDADKALPEADRSRPAARAEVNVRLGRYIAGFTRRPRNDVVQEPNIVLVRVAQALVRRTVTDKQG